jgi:hypothetical protein
MLFFGKNEKDNSFKVRRKINWKFWEKFPRTPLDVLTDEILDSLYYKHTDWEVKEDNTYSLALFHKPSSMKMAVTYDHPKQQLYKNTEIISPSRTKLPEWFGNEFEYWRTQRVRFFTINDEIFLLKYFRGEFGTVEKYSQSDYSAVFSWIKSTCQGCVYARFGKIYFTNKQDQMLYRLTWGGND